jgi:histidinol phosphatase-like PHP family hydrolase
MSEEGVDEYFDELSSLREKYKDKIKVYVGVEQDQESEKSIFLLIISLVQPTL